MQSLRPTALDSAFHKVHLTPTYLNKFWLTSLPTQNITSQRTGIITFLYFSLFHLPPIFRLSVSSNSVPFYSSSWKASCGMSPGRGTGRIENRGTSSWPQGGNRQVKEASLGGCHFNTIIVGGLKLWSLEIPEQGPGGLPGGGGPCRMSKRQGKRD